MNLLRFRAPTIDRDAAFDQALREAAIMRNAGGCPQCGRHILHPSNMARHIRAKHPDAQNTGPVQVLGDAGPTLSTPDALGSSIAA